ncbi:hypothetical protein L546_2274 [Bordetella pertussis H897]|nr:hypothetical protein L546_2274 [Bordetella pertussis H897]
MPRIRADRRGATAIVSAPTGQGGRPPRRSSARPRSRHSCTWRKRPPQHLEFEGRHGISRRPSARPPGAARTGSGPPPPFKFLSSRFRFLYY